MDQKLKSRTAWMKRVIAFLNLGPFRLFSHVFFQCHQGSVSSVLVIGYIFDKTSNRAAGSQIMYYSTLFQYFD